MQESVTLSELKAQSDCLFDEGRVHSAIVALSEHINQHYGDEELVVWVVLNGGLVFSGKLLPLLISPLTLDYVHATRYMNNQPGGELQWLAKPSQAVAGKNVLICDDIFDAGITLQAVCDFAKAEGAKSVKSAVLLNKVRERTVPVAPPDFSAAEIPDRYVFGMGMDYKNYWRNLPEIWALKE